MAEKTDAYIVPFDELRRAVGSKDKTLLAGVVDEFGWMLDEADGNREEDEELSCLEAVTALINGKNLSRLPRRLRSIYGYALEAICARIGGFVGEIHGEWDELLDEFFAEHGVPLCFSDLVLGDTVIGLPQPECHPEIGSWTPEQVAAAVGPLEQLDLEALKESDEEMADVVIEVRSWVVGAHRRGYGMMAFSIP
jgi:hypothetical protein